MSDLSTSNDCRYYREKKALIEMYSIAALRTGPSLLLNTWVCTSCPAINLQHCRTLSVFDAPWSIPHTCQKSVMALWEWAENVPWQWAFSWQRGGMHSQLHGWGMSSSCVGRQISHTSKDDESSLYYSSPLQRTIFMEKCLEHSALFDTWLSWSLQNVI